MEWMYRSNESMFKDFDENAADVVERISKHYEMHPDFVGPYVEHLKQSQRSNPRAFAGFESEMGAFKRTEEMLLNVGRRSALAFAGARVLDIGCASGHAMRAALKHGASEVVGIEYSADRASNGNTMLEMYGYPATIRTGSVLDQAITEDLHDFDFVFLFDVLEHVPTIDGTLHVARRALRDGGKVIIRSGNPYCSEFILREPHYGLPGMILLDRDAATQYHAAHFSGEYEVFEWLSKWEIEERLLDARFKPLPIEDEIEYPLSLFEEAMDVVVSNNYPTPEIAGRVLTAVKLLRNMRHSAADPEALFGVLNHTIVATAT